MSLSHALIVGAGSGLSASLARKLAARGLTIDLAARTAERAIAVANEVGATVHSCDASDMAAVNRLFSVLDADGRTPDIVIYNPSARQRGPLIELDPALVENALKVTAFGGFLVGQEAARRMLAKERGVILFTGASASVKGYAQSAPFAMGKFALRGLAQSMARELHPKGVHVGHVVIDGAIRSPDRKDRAEPTDAPGSMLDPDAIADSYLFLIDQPRSTWTWELEVRPWVERF